MITPIEIRQHTFSKSLRGYDTEEVKAFLITLSQEFEKQMEEIRKLRTELDKTKSNLENFKEMESILHKTLLQAEQSSKTTLENAKKDAELKIQEAEHKAAEIIKNALNDRSRMEREINELVS